ncbi:MAG TPA: hydrogenase/urease maturation nickel metallochaperone HypA [Armatimonadota bacterium]
MHEHGLGEGVLSALADYLTKVPPGRRLRVHLRASEMSGLSQGALQAALDHAAVDHGTPPVEVWLHADGLLGACAPCGQTVEVTSDLCCAVCGSDQITLAGGETLLVEEVLFVPVDEPEEPHG